MNLAYHKKRTLAMKELLDFIREHPGGVTHKDIKAAGLSTQWLTRLCKMGYVYGSQVKEPENGPRAYHWLWKRTGLGVHNA